MKAGRHVSALPSPCPWRPPLKCGQVQQAHPLSCASYVCVGRTCPAGSSEFLPTMWPKPATSVPLSFQTRNRWLLPLMSTVASATQTFLSPACHLPTPRSSPLLVCKKRICRESSVSLTSLFCPPCVPLFISSTQLASLCPSLSPSILHPEGSVRKWEVRKDH